MHFYQSTSLLHFFYCLPFRQGKMFFMNWNKPIKLQCTVQNYAWGSFGTKAYLNQLLNEHDTLTPKAELWMGSHVNAPSRIEGKSLREFLEAEPIPLLGADSFKKWGAQLPYLFKILCAQDALSIQLHPNKSDARLLHAADPEHYPDDNHKPEIAIALDQLEALVGFEAYDSLTQSLAQYPEIISFIGQELFEAMENALNKSETEKRQALKAAFIELNTKALQEKPLLKELSLQLQQRLLKQTRLSPKEKWYLELFPKYDQGDVGLFTIFFLNYRVLHQGEAVFLKANVPHAYLRGNIIECMANSDNVVRAGLTQKFVDVKNLARITEYELEPLPTQFPIDNGLSGKYYLSAAEEFEVHVFECGPQPLSLDLTSWHGTCIGIVLEGALTFLNSKLFAKGEVFLIPDQAKCNAILSNHTKVAITKPNWP